MDKAHTENIQVSKDGPFFSIVIPAYQCEKTLDESIESILQQDEESYEIILVDDGSTDRSGAICDYYASAFPSKVKAIHKENEGPLIARIDAVKAATGTYIMFLDADDAYSDGILSQVKKAIFEFGVDMVIFNCFRVFSDGSRHLSPPQYAEKTIFEGKSLEQLYTDAVIGANLNAVWLKCVQRTLLRNVEGCRKYGNMIMGEDKLLSLEMLSHAKRVIYLSDGLYQYHISETGLSHAFSMRHYQDMSVVYRIAVQYGKQWGIEDCVPQYNKDKVMLGIKCLYSVAEQVHKNRKEKTDFTLLAQKIIEDLDFWQAYDSCKKQIGMKIRALCWLLQHKRMEVLYVLYVGKQEILGRTDRRNAFTTSGGKLPCE